VFTGLVECVGRVVDVRRKRGALRLAVASELPQDELRDGESIAVDGVCLTVAARERDRFHADVVTETLARSTLGALRVGDAVHLERALRAGDRLGGHLVQGHVDATVEVEWLRGRGGERRLRVRLPAELAPYVALKGSIALQGVSLTVAALDAEGFEVALVPHTLERTKLGRVGPGTRLNVEVDLIARYLERLLEPRR
jgi:riboflavin synthase